MNLNYSIVELPRLANQYKEILDEFIKSGQSVAKVMDLPKGTKASSAVTYFRSIIREKGYPVKVRNLRGTISLIMQDHYKMKLNKMKLNYDVEPPRRGNQYKKILDEFIKSGKPIVEVIDMPKGTKVICVYSRFRSIIREKGYPIKVSMQKDSIFLISEKDGDLQNETKL